MAGDVRLAELCEQIVDCPHSTPVWTEEGRLVLRSQNIRNGRLTLSERSYTDEAHFAERVRRAAPRPGDLVITREAPMGEVCMIPEGVECCLGQRMVLLRPDQRKVDPRYLLYALQSERVQHEIHVSEGTGSTVSNLRIPLLEQLPIPMRPLQEQRFIAEILGSLDDKIDLNRKMRETLEAMALALFKSWFVDFDPVRAKVERRATGLSLAVEALFPDAFEQSPAGKIPKGWLVDTVGDHLLNFDSQRIPLSAARRLIRRGTYPYHGAAGVVDAIDDFLFDGVYLLLGEDGSVVDEKGFGVTQYVWGKFWVNNHAHVLQGKGAVSTEQLYLYFSFEPVWPYVTGAVQPKLSQGRLNMMPFVFAGAELCQVFADAVRPWFSRLRCLSDESRTLSSLRDALLPRLTSGELTADGQQRLAASNG